MVQLSTGTLTLLCTDLQGSTQLLQRVGEHYAALLMRYRQRLRQVVQTFGGHEVAIQGDGCLVVFADAAAALRAAIAIQRTLSCDPGAASPPMLTRIALHTGTPTPLEGSYVGLDVQRVLAICRIAHGGQILLSRPTQQRLATDLPPGVSLHDLGPYALPDFPHPERIFQIVADALPADFPPVPAPRPTNLEAQPTRLIGREQEVATICCRLCRPAVRLLTLTGPGGIGKTRLSQAVAAALLADFDHGAWFVPLAAIRDPVLVVATVAHTLRIPATTAALERAVQAFLRPRQLLLILDNFEQVRPAAAHVAALLNAAPALKVLITSRTPLNLAGEQTFPVPPLGLPDRAMRPTLDHVATSAAVALFVQRAQAVNPTFTLTPATADPVAELCVRLDGLPLAIELAAARSKLFPPRALLARLDQRLQLLTGGPQDRPARQQTMRHAIDWSYDLLAPPEQLLFRRLAVFVGGWTLAAAEAICNAQQDLPLPVAAGLRVLRDHSLLREEPGADGTPRFRCLETISAYARERLALSGEREALQAQHATFYRLWAAEAEATLLGPQAAGWLVHVAAEHDNLRAALAWYLAQDPEQGLQLATSLWPFWQVRGHLSEGRHWLDQLLAHTAGATMLQARARWCLGNLLILQGDYAAARAPLDASLAIAQAVGNLQHVAWTREELGALALFQGEAERAQTLLEASLGMFRALGDQRGVGVTLRWLGHLARAAGDLERATALLEESLCLMRPLGDQQAIGWTLKNLGEIARLRGAYVQAAELLHERLTLSRAIGDRQAAGWTLGHLGHLATVQGEAGRARALLDEALALLTELGDRLGVGWVLGLLGNQARVHQDTEQAHEFLAASLTHCRDLAHQGVFGDEPYLAYALYFAGLLALQQRRHMHGLRLLAAAERHHVQFRTLLDPRERAELAASLAAAAETMGEAAYTRAWAEGQRLTWEAAVAHALGRGGANAPPGATYPEP